MDASTSIDTSDDWERLLSLDRSLEELIIEKEKLYQWLAPLGPKAQMAIRGTLDGYTRKEIAMRDGVTEEAMHSTIRRAYSKLRDAGDPREK